MLDASLGRSWGRLLQVQPAPLPCTVQCPRHGARRALQHTARAPLPSHATATQVTVDSGTADWTRRAVKEATGAAQDVAYVVRGDTDGPANPGCSGVQDGETVVGEYQVRGKLGPLVKASEHTCAPPQPAPCLPAFPPRPHQHLASPPHRLHRPTGRLHLLRLHGVRQAGWKGISSTASLQI